MLKALVGSIHKWEVVSNTSDLEELVVEDLIDNDFIPGEDEAYATITAKYEDLYSGGRVGSYFARQLDDLDWERIEKKVLEAKPKEKKKIIWVRDDCAIEGFIGKIKICTIKEKGMGCYLEFSPIIDYSKTIFTANLAKLTAERKLKEFLKEADLIS